MHLTALISPRYLQTGLPVTTRPRNPTPHANKKTGNAPTVTQNTARFVRDLAGAAVPPQYDQINNISLRIEETRLGSYSPLVEEADRYDTRQVEI
jgi:hypothetical protein